MAEPRFAALRDYLESTVDDVEFAEIRSRRLRRTQRWAMAGVAALTVVAVGAGALTVGVLRHAGPDPVIAPTGPDAPSPTPTALGAVAGLAAAPSGSLFAVTAGDSVTLLRSPDLGATWTVAGRLPAGASVPAAPLRLFAATDNQLWVLTTFALYSSTDGGRHWSVDPFTNLDPRGAIEAGGTLWFQGNDALQVAAGGGRPVVAPAQPGGTSTLSALGGGRALVGNGRNTWRRTADGGRTWTAVANPCAGTHHIRPWQATAAPAPDGSLWLVCAGQPDTGQMPMDLVVSVDSGQTWSPRGTLEHGGYGRTLYPMSRTVAWRTGDQSDLYRTTDGTHWTDVLTSGDHRVQYVTPVDATTAVYARLDPGAPTRIYLTRDGGHTWTYHRFAQ